MDTGVAVGDELTNMAAISDDEELSNTSKVTVKVAAPAEDAVSDAGATADSDAAQIQVLNAVTFFCWDGSLS